MVQSSSTAGWQRTLVSAWTHRGWLAWLLWPLSLIYHLLWTLKRLAYSRQGLQPIRLTSPVVVVGNFLAGGAGKTPVVMALTEHLLQRGILVGVISRGHGRSTRGCQQVTLARSAQQVGDEPMLIHRRTGVPVFVAEQRVAAAQALLAHYPQTQILISDDGLQHLQLARDLEIGVFDDRGVGNGFLLPAGPLREPWPRALDLLLHTGERPAFDGFQAQRRLADYAVRADGTRVALADLAGSSTATGLSDPTTKPLLALAGIAQPERFFAMLRAQGVPLADTLALPDHYDFDSDTPLINKGYRLICTEKDAVKLWPSRPDALAVPLLCELPDAFWRVFDAQLDRLLICPTDPLSSRHGHTTT